MHTQLDMPADKYLYGDLMENGIVLNCNFFALIIVTIMITNNLLVIIIVTIINAKKLFIQRHACIVIV